MNSALTPPAELPGLRKLSPKEQSQRASSFACLAGDGKPGCEQVVWLGMFFDGTNNNKNRDMKDDSHSNIVVLFNTFRDSEKTGYFRHYIPGLGTAFPEIGEQGESENGKAMAAGGDARIHYAMIQVYNSVHQAVFTGRPLVSPAEARTVVTSIEKGLKTVWLLGGAKRMAYFRELETRLVTAIAGRRPVVKLINISVFGFSRGAAESRAFCNWLVECCKKEKDGYTFCGIPVRFQFLGVFDTVASVGLADSSPIGSGFLDWADGTMAIPEVVERCVHFVAAHEIRQSFPLSTGRDGTEYAANCVEVVYPGAHCDVGGGYAPGDQGKALKSRSHLASQVPLGNMYLEAQRSGVPLLTINELRQTFNQKTIDDLSISEKLARRFQQYASWSRVHSGTVEQVFFEHMRLYWRWRLHAGPNFAELVSFREANDQDKEDLFASEQDFLHDMQIVERKRKSKSSISDVHAAAAAENEKKLAVPVEVDRFFDEHIHDSHASFRLLGPMTAEERRLAVERIKRKKAAGKKLNNLEAQALAKDMVTPGAFPVMHDSDISDLYEMAGLGSSLAVKAITDTRRESGGHVRKRRVFDKS